MMKAFNKVFVILLTFNLVHASHWLAANQAKCQFTLNTELMIFFTDNPSLFVNSLKKRDLSECRAACCSHDTCNGYVWDDLETDNCRLLRCSKKGDDCKKALKPSDTQNYGEVGFITGYADDSSAPSENTVSTTSVTTTTKQTTTIDPLIWLNQKIQQNAVNTTSKLNSSGDAAKKKVANLLQMKNNDKKGGTVKPTKKTNVTAHTTHHSSHHTKKHTTTQPPSPSVIAVLSSPDEKHEHTNNVSLTIALMFGIGFSMTILYMLGRRWVEGIKDKNKRGYTRVSYLLNGV